MTDQTTAVAVKPEEPQPLTTQLVSLAGRGEVERFKAAITLPVDFQYGIPKWIKTGERPNGDPIFAKEIEKVGINASGYEYMNTVIGARFFLPPSVPNRDGQIVPNPIVEPPDYCRLLLGCLWYNQMGQHMVSYEVVEVDFWLIYQETRTKKDSAKMVVDPETFQPSFDKRGIALLELSEKDEMAAYKDLAARRALGPRYAQTIARVRLLKQASGIRELPAAPDKQLHQYPLTLTGFRDQLDAREAVAAAVETEVSLYGVILDEGSPDSLKPLTAAQMAEAGVTDEADDAAVVEGFERTAVADAQEARATAEPSAPPAAPPAQPAPSTALAQCNAPGTGVAEGEVCGLAVGHGGMVHKSMTASWPMAK
jgi:hypothetical protein